MPIYEFRCQECRNKLSQLVLRAEEVMLIKCDCGSNNLQRLISQVNVQQSEESRLAKIDTTQPRGLEYYKDNRNVGLWTKKRMRELGQEGGSSIDEIIEKGRGGQFV